MVGIIGIIVSLGLLMYLAYRGISVLVLAPILALLASLLSDMPLLAMFTQVFMPHLSIFLRSFFPLFLLGAIFGKVMEETGAAKAIAHAITTKLGKEKAILSVVLTCAILTYGGVSLFVVVFAVYPVAAHLFREANIPKRLIPGAIALGAFTFTMTAIPGTPQIQNAIPMPFFRTTAYAAPVLGLVASLVMAVLGILWLMARTKKLNAAGEGYGNHLKEDIKEFDTANLPSVFLSILPFLIVLGLNFIMVTFFFTANNPAFDWLRERPFETNINAVRGTWGLIVALAAGIVFAILLNFKRFNVKEALNAGATASLIPILNTASVVGFGNVVRALGAFTIIQTALLGISENPLITSSIATTLLAGITGSASGGLGIALTAMGEKFYQQALAVGLNPEVLHRVVSIACGGLDTLPHNGAVVTLLIVTQLNHKQSYADVGMVSVLIPIVALVTIILLAGIGIV